MKTVQIIGVIIAGTGLASVLVMKGSQTANIVGSFFSGVAKWQKTSQGRG